MWILRAISLAFILPLTSAQAQLAEPECATNCWENTKYVSKCISSDDACLCSESKYQKSTYQCIYSQCDTAHFASALHYILSKCNSTDNELLFAVPPMPDQDELRRREEEYVSGDKIYGSGSAIGYPMESASPLPVGSAKLPRGSVPLPTEVVGLPMESAGNVVFPQITESPTPVFFRRLAMIPSMTTSIPSSTLGTTLPIITSLEFSPRVLTASGFRLEISFLVPVAITLFCLYLAA